LYHVWGLSLRETYSNENKRFFSYIKHKNVHKNATNATTGNPSFMTIFVTLYKLVKNGTKVKGEKITKKVLILLIASFPLCQNNPE
jgi:hypothetical protein